MDVDRLLSGLSAKQSRAIRDTHIDGLSIAEAASRADIGEFRRQDFGASGIEGTRCPHQGRPAMNTDQLIQSLSENVPSVPRRALGRRIGFGMIGGAIVTMGLVASVLGIRPDIHEAMDGSPSG